MQVKTPQKYYIAIYFLFLILSNVNASSMINSFIEVDKDSIANDNKLQGKMTINGQTYTAICDCDPVTPKPETPFTQTPSTTPACDPSKLKIQLERQGKGASFDDIRALIGNIEELNYVQVPYTSFKCLDGRHNKPVIATPGGDAGEFILALSVYEDLVGGGKKLTQENVDTFLTEYLKQMQHNTFYMCTDDMAVSHLEKEMQIEGLNLFNPRTQIINELSELIIKPENIGDLHIKMMLKYPEQFSIRKEIVEMFLRSFYKILWNKNNELSSKIELDILSGEHNESAFVEVRSEHACQAQELAPLIPSKNKNISVFVNHLDAVSIQRAKIAQFFSDKVNTHQDPVDAVKMQNRLNHHGYIALEITGSYIAKGLPFISINLA